MIAITGAIGRFYAYIAAIVSAKSPLDEPPISPDDWPVEETHLKKELDPIEVARWWC